MKIVTTKTLEIKPQHIEDFIYGVVENDASNYWAGWIRFYQDDKKVTYTKIDFSRDFGWTIIDSEDESSVYKFKSTGDIPHLVSRVPELITYLELMTDDQGIDAGDADTLFQLLTLGEVTFG